MGRHKIHPGHFVKQFVGVAGIEPQSPVAQPPTQLLVL